jgi:hypothetical protein
LHWQVSITHVVPPKPVDGYFTIADVPGVVPPLAIIVVDFDQNIFLQDEQKNLYEIAQVPSAIDRVSDLLLRGRGVATVSCNGVTYSEYNTFFPSSQTICPTLERTTQARPNRWTIGFPIAPSMRAAWQGYTCQLSLNPAARYVLANAQKEVATFTFQLRFSAPKCVAPPVITPPRVVGPQYPTENIPVASSISSVQVQNHWSEGVTLPRPDQSNVLNENAMQVNCPHLESGLLRWETPATWPNNAVPQANGQPFSIPAGRSVLVSGSSLARSGFYGYITVPATSRLIFADENIELHTMGMDIAGVFAIGGAQCRMTSRIRILLYGSRSAQPLPADPWVKGIHVTGVLDIHGQVYTPTWTRLATTARAGDTVIYVQDLVNWQVGQTIAITTTVLKDSLDFTQNEVRTISRVQRAPHLGPRISAITLNERLGFNHYGGREYQAEVALLSRNIVIQGVNSLIDFPTNQRCTGNGHGTSTFPCKAAEGFGGHVIIVGNGIGRCTAVELFEMGQTNVMARYPFHFHMLGNNGARSFFVDGSIHRSFWRCVTIHGTNQAYVARNTAYHISGHCFYLEDGVEENNTLEHNFAGYIHMMGPITNPGRYYSQELDDVWSQASVLVPSDVTAAGFYIPNPNNIYRGNAASGGWAGFAFPDFPRPTGLSRGVNIVPSSRPSGIFDGNSAHSSGHWWSNAGAIYMGGQFTQDNDNPNSQKYNPGRQSGKSFHETCSGPLESWGRCAIHNRRWLRFSNTKVFLASRGLMHWGERAELIRFEAHDTGIAANVFGQVWIDQFLVTCRSANSQPKYNNCPSSNNEYWNCHIRDLQFFYGFAGFQWYGKQKS